MGKKWGNRQASPDGDDLRSRLAFAQKALRRLRFPGVCEKVPHQLDAGPAVIHADRREPLSPPYLGANVGVLVHGDADAVFVEHHIHVVGVPLRREDLPPDAVGRPSVMILLHRFRQSERELPCALRGERQSSSRSVTLGWYVPKLQRWPSGSRAVYSRDS